MDQEKSQRDIHALFVKSCNAFMKTLTTGQSEELEQTEEELTVAGYGIFIEELPCVLRPATPTTEGYVEVRNKLHLFYLLETGVICSSALVTVNVYKKSGTKVSDEEFLKSINMIPESIKGEGDSNPPKN